MSDEDAAILRVAAGELVEYVLHSGRTTPRSAQTAKALRVLTAAYEQGRLHGRGDGLREALEVCSRGALGGKAS